MCSPVDRKRQSVDQFLVGNDLVLTGRDTGRYSPLSACGPSFASHACWLISPFFATGVGLVGRSQKKRSSSAMCDFSLHHVKSRPARSVTSLRPATSTPVHVGLPHLRIPQRRSAFFPEWSSPFPRR